MLLSRAGGDDADDFFAIVLLSIHMHKPSSTATNPASKLSDSDSVPALFPRQGIAAFWIDKTVRIFKNQRRHGERKPP
jgi:hypothetical protein